MPQYGQTETFSVESPVGMTVDVSGMEPIPDCPCGCGKPAWGRLLRLPDGRRAGVNRDGRVTYILNPESKE